MENVKSKLREATRKRLQKLPPDELPAALQSIAQHEPILKPGGTYFSTAKFSKH